MVMVYILIPAHNNNNEVLEILDCLYKQTYRDINIILVDDGSVDGTEEMVRNTFPEVEVLKGDGHLWWTGANVMGVNYILEKAKPDDFILLLNNDLTVNDDYIEILVNASIYFQRAIVGSVTVDYNNHGHMESGIRFDSSLNIFSNTDRDIIENTEYDTDTDTLPGRGTLIPIEVFKTVGNFNIKLLPHYGADYEFIVRARRAGFSALVANKARVYAKLNITGLSVSDKKYISVRECFTLLFSKKSKINFFYYLSYVWLVSGQKFKLKNIVVSALHILVTTLFRTVYLYPLHKFIFRFPMSVYTFLFKGYPLCATDMEQCSIDTRPLVDSGMLKEHCLKGVPFYYITPKFEFCMKTLPINEKNKLYCLKRRCFKYSHKVKIIQQKVNLWMPLSESQKR